MTSFDLLDDGGAPAPGVPAPGVPAPVRGVLRRALPLTKGVIRPRRRLADLPDGREGVTAFLGKRPPQFPSSR